MPGTTHNTLQAYFGHLSNQDPPVPPVVVKPAMTGIVVDSFADVAGWTPHLGGVCTNIAFTNWANLQPTEGGPIDQSGTGWQEIENCLSTGLPVCIRVQTGYKAPAWARDLTAYGGPGISYTDPFGNVGTVTIPRWWQQGYLDAWLSFMGLLAALFESNSQVVEVHSHPASTLYIEPFIYGTANATNIATYQAAGLGGCQTDSHGNIIGPDPLQAYAIQWPTTKDANGHTKLYNAGWTTTRFMVCHNPLQAWKTSGASITDPAGWTETEIDRAANVMGARIDQGNTSLGAPMAQWGPKYYPMVQKLIRPDIYHRWQMRTTARLLSGPSSYGAAYSPAAGWLVDHTGTPTAKDAITAVMSLAFGAGEDPATTWPASTGPALVGTVYTGNDPENMLGASGIPSMNARAVEVTSGIPTGFNPAILDYYTSIAYGMPAGG